MLPETGQYREFAPCEALREHVRAFFSFAPPQEHTRGGRPLLREVRLREGDPFCPHSFADGHVSVAFSFERGWACDGHWRRVLPAPRGEVIGPMSAVGATSLDQIPEAVGVFLRAGRARALTGAAPAELADRSVALADLWGADAAGLPAELAASGEAVRIDRLESILRARGRLKIERLAGAAGASRQHLARSFREAVGWLLVCALSTTALAATRPRYGGTLRVEIHASIDTADPPQLGPGMPDLAPEFSITRWEAGRSAVYAADENAPGGRPFADEVQVELARPPRGQTIDLDVGKADLIEIPPGEARRQAAGRRSWVSQPVRVLLLEFGARVEDARAREALSLAVDRTAILNVLLQKQGEISGALLPQWLSGYAFVFNAASGAARARELAAAIPAPARSFSIGVDDAALRPIAERIALNAHDAGLTVSLAPQAGAADVRLLEVRISTADPARALAGIAAMLDLAAPPRTDSAAALYDAERALLDGFRVVPLFHLSDVYGVAARVKGGPGISPLGEWRFANLWLEGDRP